MVLAPCPVFAEKQHSGDWGGFIEDYANELPFFVLGPVGIPKVSDVAGLQREDGVFFTHAGVFAGVPEGAALR